MIFPPVPLKSPWVLWWKPRAVSIHQGVNAFVTGGWVPESRTSAQHGSGDGSCPGKSGMTSSMHAYIHTYIHTFRHTYIHTFRHRHSHRISPNICIFHWARRGPRSRSEVGGSCDGMGLAPWFSGYPAGWWVSNGKLSNFVRDESKSDSYIKSLKIWMES